MEISYMHYAATKPDDVQIVTIVIPFKIGEHNITCIHEDISFILFSKISINTIPMNIFLHEPV